MQIKWSTLILAALALAANAAVVGAQDTKEREKKVQQRLEEEVIVRAEGEAVGRAPRADNTFVFLSSEMSLGGKVVKGAPYSAEAVTESVQTLADGNRIVRKNTSQLYRDSEGRTRREQTLNILGPYAPAGEAPRTVLINDPVAGVNYALDPRNHTARKLTVLHFESRVPGPAQAGGGSQGAAAASADAKRVLEQSFIYSTQGGVPLPPPPPPGAHGVGIGGPNVFVYSGKADERNVKTESLGKQIVEGVEAEGTRTTTTIPAGQIGNEQPIDIVSERWYSPELQVVVKTVNSDPRTGTTTYRLTNILRAEPSAMLFQVPSDYTVQEGPTFAPRVRTFRRSTPGGGTNKENQ